MSSQFINRLIWDKEFLDIVVDVLSLRCVQLEILLDMHPCDEYEKEYVKCRNVLFFYNINLDFLDVLSGDPND